MGLSLGLGVNLLAAATGAVARPLTLHALQRHVQPSAPPLQVVLKANAGPEAKVPQQLGQVMTFNHLQLVYVDGLIWKIVINRFSRLKIRLSLNYFRASESILSS